MGGVSRATGALIHPEMTPRNRQHALHNDPGNPKHMTSLANFGLDAGKPVSVASQSP